MPARNGRPDPGDRLAAIHARLTAAVEELAASDAWRRMLTVAARFPTYSRNNVLLIALQRPDATRVCGLRAWNSLGRRVRKGEKGIAILAPCLYRGPEEDVRPEQHVTETEPPARAAARQLRGFRVVHVFDVNQTEGESLPEVAPEQLLGTAPDLLWERLAALAHADGFTVERGDCGGANGHTRFHDRVIRVRDDADDAQAVKSLAHELGHIRADHETRFLDRYHDSPACRGLAEVEAESIAYLVTTSAGLSTDAYSVPYLAGWSDGNAELLRDTAARVLDTARAITTDLALDSRQGPEAPRLGTVGMPPPSVVLEAGSREPPQTCR